MSRGGRPEQIGWQILAGRLPDIRPLAIQVGLVVFPRTVTAVTLRVTRTGPAATSTPSTPTTRPLSFGSSSSGSSRGIDRGRAVDSKGQYRLDSRCFRVGLALCKRCQVTGVLMGESMSARFPDRVPLRPAASDPCRPLSPAMRAAARIYSHMLSLLDLFAGAHWVTTGSQPSVLQSSFPGPS